MSCVILFCLLVGSLGQFHGRTYQQQTRQAKMAQLWSATTNDTKGLPWYGTLAEAELFIEPMNLTFDEVRDDMPYQFLGLEERKKLIHTVGLVGQARFDVSSNNLNYTGIFASGSDNCLIRFSLAQPPQGANCKSGCFTPGISVKFLRDRVQASTLLGLYSLYGQESFNFFAHDVSTQPPDFGDWIPYALKLVRDKFAESSNFPTMLGLSAVASHDQSGASVQQPNFPFRIVFHPTKQWHQAFPDQDPGVPFTTQLMKTLTRGPVYDVYAQEMPLDMKLTKIGTISLTGPVTTSTFGDRSYFMQHQRWEDDGALRPEWVSGAIKNLAMQRSYPTAPGYTYPDLPW